MRFALNEAGYNRRALPRRAERCRVCYADTAAGGMG